MATNEEWIVAFISKPERPAWFHWWTHKDFKHCMAFKYEPLYKVWISYNWGKNGIDISILSKEQMLNASLYFKDNHNAKFLIVPVKELPNYYIMELAFTNCVTAVRHLVGIRKWMITPYKLYCALKSMGCKEYLENINDKEA